MIGYGRLAHWSAPGLEEGCWNLRPQARALHIPLTATLSCRSAAGALPQATARCYEADAGRPHFYGSPPSKTLTSGDLEMTEATVPSKTTLHCALELSKS